MGGAAGTSWLVRSTPDWADQFQALWVVQEGVCHFPNYQQLVSLPLKLFVPYHKSQYMDKPYID